MKNSKLTKIVLIILISMSILFVAREVLAATDLTDTLTGNNIINNITTITGNEVLNTTENNTVNNATANNVVLTTNNTTNSSTYNNTSLPDTGIEDSIPSVVLVVVLGISAVYAYKKMQDYSNI